MFYDLKEKLKDYLYIKSCSKIMKNLFRYCKKRNKKFTGDRRDFGVCCDCEYKIECDSLIYCFNRLEVLKTKRGKI